MTPEMISALAIAISGLLTALCVGLRQLHMKHLKIKDCLEVDMASSVSDKKSFDNSIV